MSFDPKKNKAPNLKLVPPSLAPRRLGADARWQMLLSSSIADFIEGDMGQAMAGLEALSAYAEAWPDECLSLGPQLHVCELAFQSWQPGFDFEALGKLFWAARQSVSREDNQELLHFVFDATAHSLLQRQMFSDMREQLAWARTLESTSETRLLLLAYELALSVRQSGAAGASETLISKLSKAMIAPYSFEKFTSWFPVYMCGMAMANYNLEAGNLLLARQHVAGARNLALLANAPLFEIRALELEVVISCKAKKPMAMYDARTDIHKISTILNLELETDPPKANPKGGKIGEVPSTVSLDNGSLKTNDSEQVLTKRERNVLKRVQCGDRNKEIARLLNITEDTVKYHLKKIFSKLGVSKRVQAVKVAQQKGYIPLLF